MRLCTYILISAALVSASISASATVRFFHPTLPPNCDLKSNSLKNQSTEMIHLANITSDTDDFGNVDGRGNLSEKVDELGLSEDVEKIKKSSGFVICPGTDRSKESISSAALVGSNMQIVTAAHAFFDKEGNERSPLSKCFFRNQEEPYIEIPLDFASNTHKLGRVGRIGLTEPNDYAVVRLMKPVKGAVPFQMDLDGYQENEPIIALAAHQLSPTRKFSIKEPVAQQCRVRKVMRPSNAPTQYFTDCDYSPLGSGGVVLTRDANGLLRVGGISVVTGVQGKNGDPYSYENESYTRVVGLDSGFAQSVNDVRSSIPVEMANLQD